MFCHHDSVSVYQCPVIMQTTMRNCSYLCRSGVDAALNLGPGSPSSVSKPITCWSQRGRKAEHPCINCGYKKWDRPSVEGRRTRGAGGSDSVTGKSCLAGGEERKIEGWGEEGSRNGGQDVGGGGTGRKRVKRQHHPLWCYTSVFSSVLSKFISGLERW